MDGDFGQPNGHTGSSGNVGRCCIESGGSLAFSPPMKLRVSRSNLKRKKKVGFRTRSKTAGGRKIIKRKLKRSGKFRVG